MTVLLKSDGKYTEKIKFSFKILNLILFCFIQFLLPDFGNVSLFIFSQFVETRFLVLVDYVRSPFEYMADFVINASIMAYLG